MEIIAMNVSKTLGATGWTVTAEVNGCADYSFGSLERELQSVGWRVTYTPNGCLDE